MAILHKTIALNNGVSSNKQDAFQDGSQNLKFKLGSDIVLTLDVAASELYREGYYYLDSEKKKLTSEGLEKIIFLLLIIVIKNRAKTAAGE